MSRTAFRAGRDQASLSENMELLTGQRGDGSSRAVTYKDLAKLGVLTLRRGAGGKVVPEIVKPGDKDNSVSRPTKPQNVKATGGFGSILVTWDNPTYSGHAYAEVFRHTENAIAEATLIATVNANVFGDIVPLGSKFFYWVRFVNINNTQGAHSDSAYAETSQNISDVIDEIGDQMRESELIQELNKKNSDNETKISEVSETVSKIDKDGSMAHKALWAKKAQAGQITAGIGIIAKSDGTSQVAVSASQFFVFDPNNPNGTITPTFAIDKGRVVIPKALIENATIQILKAQEITADYVRSGIEMSSPKINAGEFRGGDAGFGAGGPYNGYRTFIHSNGLLQTNHLQANGGYINNVLAQNVTIAENCTIRGHLDGATGNFKGRFEAEQMIGDVVGARIYSASPVSVGSDGGSWSSWVVFSSFNILEPRLYPRTVKVTVQLDLLKQYEVTGPDPSIYSVNGQVRLRSSWGEVTSTVNRYSYRVSETSHLGKKLHISLIMEIPANSHGKVFVELRGSGRSSGGLAHHDATLRGISGNNYIVEIFRSSAGLG